MNGTDGPAADEPDSCAPKTNPYMGETTQLVYVHGYVDGREIARCCQGCPDCVGIGMREQVKALTAENETLRQRLTTAVAACERFETTGKLGALSGYQHSTHVRDILTDFGREATT